MVKSVLPFLVGLLVGAIVCLCVCVLVINPFDWNGLSAVAGVALVLVGVYYTWATVWMLRAIRQQLADSRVNITNDHNWRILEHWKKMPPALPEWYGLTTRSEWYWRILHLNHINMLQYAWEQHRDGIYTDQQFAGWRRMGQSWFQHLYAPSTNDPELDAQLDEGRRQLRVILHRRNGYQDGFIKWLKDGNVIPAGLFQERDEIPPNPVGGAGH